LPCFAPFCCGSLFILYGTSPSCVLGRRLQHLGPDLARWDSGGSTFTGLIATTYDALVLFEACLRGHLNHVPRRPHDRERNFLIRSGCVFIYVANESSIKRWTDGVNWSPSYILGNFLIYRELDQPFPPGEKQRTIKRRQQRTARPGEPYPRPDSTGESYSPTTSQSTSLSTRTPTDAERQLIGSLTDSYGFKPNSLVKKTISVTVQDVTHHLISYYDMKDIKMAYSNIHLKHLLSAPLDLDQS
jgi:hypothetical protein